MFLYLDPGGNADGSPGQADGELLEETAGGEFRVPLRDPQGLYHGSIRGPIRKYKG